TPTPTSSVSVSRIAAGRTLPVKCAHNPSEPAEAVTTRARIGAATASATAAETISQGFHRSRLGTAGGSLLIEADFVDEPACGIALLRDVGERRRIHLEITERSDDRVDLGALLHRVLVVRFGVQLLRIVGNEILEQTNRVVPVRRIAGDRRAGDVHVRAAALEGRQEDLDRFAPLFLLRAAPAAPHEADII